MVASAPLEKKQSLVEHWLCCSEPYPGVPQLTWAGGDRETKRAHCHAHPNGESLLREAVSISLLCPQDMCQSSL